MERTFNRGELFRRSTEYAVLQDTWMRSHPRRELQPSKPKRFECLAPLGCRCKHLDRKGRCCYLGKCQYKGKRL